MNRKKIMIVIGTRPEAIKMVPVILELFKFSKVFETVIVSTGQHRQMLNQILGLFQIKPKYDLDIMKENQSITEIVTNSLKGLEQVIIKEKPDALLVQGDTSTAFAAGLAAFQNKVVLGHVEAGLRTYNKYNPYPEEMNRSLISTLADIHFAPTLNSKKNLLKENVAAKSIYLTGNTVIDALHLTIKKPYNLEELHFYHPNKKIILVTAHRRESFGAPIKRICDALLQIAEKYADSAEIILPVHPNPNVRQVVRSKLSGRSNISLIEPMDYHPFAHLMSRSYLILTDSGGIQEEAPSLGKPVLVMRETTERPEAVQAGTVKIIGTDPDVIMAEVEVLLNSKKAYDKMANAVNPYGDGLAAKRIVSAVGEYFKLAEFSFKRVPDLKNNIGVSVG